MMPAEPNAVRFAPLALTGTIHNRLREGQVLNTYRRCSPSRAPLDAVPANGCMDSAVEAR